MAEMTAKFEVPKEIIDGHIRAALTDALSKHSDTLVRDLVERAMRVPGTDRYGSPSRDKTVIDDAIEKAIVNETKAGIEEWVAEQRPKIQAQVRAALTAKGGAMVKKIVDNLGVHLAHGFDISVFLKDPPR
jgi:hypothetical protein